MKYEVRWPWHACVFVYKGLILKMKINKIVVGKLRIKSIKVAICKWQHY